MNIKTIAKILGIIALGLTVLPFLSRAAIPGLRQRAREVKLMRELGLEQGSAPAAPPDEEDGSDDEDVTEEVDAHVAA